MRREDDEINPFSREYTAKQSTAKQSTADRSHPAPPPPRKTGGGSFWVWLIPLLVVIFVFPLVCCGGLAFWGVGKAVEGMNKPLDAAVAAIEADNRMTAKLGTPIERVSSFGVSEYHYDNGNGSAEVDFTIKGPDGSARVRGKMKLFADVWSPEDLTITCHDGTEFKLPGTVDVEAARSF